MKLDNCFLKLKRIIDFSFMKNNELCFQAMSAYAFLQYQYNQKYFDDFVESKIIRYSELYQLKLNTNEICSGTVLFYDRFGLDNRGIALIYVKALVELGYKVIYLTKKGAINTQPSWACINERIVREYIDTNIAMHKQIKIIQECVKKYRPENSYILTLPYDVSGVIAFQSLKTITTRIFIDITDHAFWLGINCADKYIEYRNKGANISLSYRKIPSEKIYIQPYYPYVDESIPFDGFQFDLQDKHLLFSGGAVYKTIDEELTYYKILDHILKDIPDLVFLYAGSGAKDHFNQLMRKYPGRVFVVDERKDFYQVLLHSYAYLNTFPVLGGLMMQYAIRAGKVPFTLLHGAKETGVLNNEVDLDFIQEDSDLLIKEIKNAFENQDYMNRLINELSDLIIDERSFRNNIDMIMRNDASIIRLIKEEYELDSFRKAYRDRFNDKDIIRIIGSKYYPRLIPFFPIIFLKRAFNFMVKTNTKIHKSSKQKLTD